MHKCQHVFYIRDIQSNVTKYNTKTIYIIYGILQKFNQMPSLAMASASLRRFVYITSIITEFFLIPYLFSFNIMKWR